MENKIATLVLSSRIGDWAQIYSHGQQPTWIDSFRRQSQLVLPYYSNSLDKVPPLVAISGRLIAASQRLEEMVNKTPLNHVRPVRARPGVASLLLESNSRTPESRVSFVDGALEINVPEGLPFLGLRTLQAMKFMLENHNFEFLARTNTSSYLNLERLTDLVTHAGGPGKILALQGKWGPHRYPSGALYVLHRQEVEKIVKSATRWIHEYVDDVSMGLILSSLGVRDFVSIPRFEFDFESDIVDPPSNFHDFAHFRCKSPDPEIAIMRMKALHSKLWS